ncbi:hypothetical protein [Streptomyces coeruleorubidus]|uniref:Uncharacterized protein n=1 Tax=Streptomyces coeruleorubidus TaxID=116188 RepID=A0A5J6HUQ9_STRC4|nr:hypothetical protein [Streptomyces coeruleorubidus]QEV23976.1 hypothetical protein CP976_07330 [Streptomyces coeruleorubidus]GGT85677.1 hypothetical protein GCM10010256_52240 [Streptomyces coeruleorubidus]
MPSSAQTVQPTTTAYHWVMSVQTPDGRFNTRSAIVDVPGGVTRQQVFEFVYKQFAEEYGATLVVLFFDLQPNQL